MTLVKKSYNPNNEWSIFYVNFFNFLISLASSHSVKQKEVLFFSRWLKFIWKIMDGIICSANYNLESGTTIGAGAVQTSERYYEWWLVYKLQTMVNKAWAELTMISKGVHDI